MTAVGYRTSMSKPAFLSMEQLSEVLDSFPANHTVSVVRIRYKNRQEIRTPESFQIEHLKAFLESCSEAGHQPGGDLELEIPALGKTLVGHHDGLYWFEANRQK